jgi:hypothetical protein
VSVFLICPVRGCGLRMEVSHDDPDASQSQLWRHFQARHPEQTPGELLSQAKAVDSSGRILSEAEVAAWMSAPAE